MGKVAVFDCIADRVIAFQNALIPFFPLAIRVVSENDQRAVIEHQSADCERTWLNFGAVQKCLNQPFS
jgi:hypothetical protein